MYVKYLELKNYRNYEILSMKFNKKTNILVGDNAQGKTNILESIYYCSLGKSHRTNKDKELINWKNKESYISVYVAKERLDKKIDIKIFKEGKKGAKINSIKINSFSELIGTFNVVMFSPEDLKIVKESPSYRRRFLDIELCKMNKKYYYSLLNYNKVLGERNATLRKWNNNTSILLDVYDKQLCDFGEYIIKCRIDYLKKLNIISKNLHEKITSEQEFIKINYISSIKNFNKIKEQLLNEFKENRQRDIEKRITSSGPHRDDFSIYINDVDTRKYGSQGQQRTAILTIKFASLQIIKDSIGEYPVLLLDDVLSELDVKRQKFILNSINDYQTIITCTGIEDIKKYLHKDISVFNIINGKIKDQVI
ncbi:DNA replication/repair protein RecF [Clostridium sp. DL1XJH146]